MERTVILRVGWLDNHHQLQAAIGYLSMWSYSRYDKVTIYTVGKEGDIQASYEDSRTDDVYLIHGLYRDGGYTFHS